MPGIPTHMLMAEMALTGDGPSSTSAVQSIVQGNEDVYLLGAVGPDLAFFAPDFSASAPAIVRIVAEVYDAVIAPIVDFHETYVEPVLAVLDEIEDGVEEVLDSVTCGLVGAVGGELAELADRVVAYATTSLAAVVIDPVAIFDEMEPPIQEGKKIGEWYWFDTLHNRRTGALIARMWEDAASDRERAYVLGYATHFAGDFVGHQYVNAVVGSPARARLHRHHMAENVIDTHIFDVFRNQEITDSSMHLLLPHGDVVEHENSLLVVLDRVNEIPDDLQPIFDLLSSSIEATFAGTDHPTRIPSHFLSAENFNTAFWPLLVSLKASTASHIAPPKNPVPEVLDAAADAVRDFLETLADPPKPPSSKPDMCFAIWDPKCDVSVDAIKKWVDSIVDAIEYFGALLKWLGGVLASLWKAGSCLLTAPVRTLLQGSLYLANVAMHDLLDDVREVLALGGLTYPTRDFVRSRPIAAQFLTIERLHVSDSAEERFPHRAASTNATYLEYPTTPLEGPSTVSAGFAMGTPADAFVETFPVDATQLAEFASARIPADSVAVARRHVDQPLASAVPFIRLVHQQMLDGAAGELPDFSLDADRGVGHLNWRIAEGAETSVQHDFVGQVPYDWDLT